MLSEMRDQITEALGYPCPVGIGKIRDADLRFDTKAEALAYLIGYCEDKQTTSGHYIDHKGRMIATGQAAETLASLTRDIREKDLYIIGLERRLTAASGISFQRTPVRGKPSRVDKDDIDHG